MAKAESTTTTYEDKGDCSEVARTTSSHESDSIMLKKDAKGVYSWEIKAYGDFGVDNGVTSITYRLRQVNRIIQGEYGQ